MASMGRLFQIIIVCIKNLRQLLLQSAVWRLGERVVSLLGPSWFAWTARIVFLLIEMGVVVEFIDVVQSVFLSVHGKKAH